MADYREQTDNFTFADAGAWHASAQGAQCRVTLPPGVVSGPFSLLVEMTGVASGASPNFTWLWDGVPPNRGNVVYLVVAGTNASGSVVVDPQDPDLGPGARTLWIAVMRTFAGFSQDECFFRIPVTVAEPNPRLRPLYSNVPIVGAAPVTLGTLTKPISSRLGTANSPVVVRALPGSGPVQYGARVFATPAATGIPHLDKRGGVRTTYDPVNSILVREIQDVDPFEFIAHPELITAVKAAGVNAVGIGFMLPAATAQTVPWSMADFAGAALDNLKAKGGFLVIGPDEADNLDILGGAGPWPSRAVLYPLCTARSLPMCLPGKLMAALEASGYADVTGRYHDEREIGWSGPRGYYPAGVWGRWTRAFLDGELLPAPDPTKPLLVLIGIDAGIYTKVAAGASYNPAGGDTLEQSDPVWYILMQVGLALSRNCSILHAYGYDAYYQKDQRGAAPLGSQFERRCDAFGQDAEYWTALSVAFNAVALWEERLLSPPASALNRGPGFVSFARDGGAGKRLWLAVNCTDAARPGIGGAPAGAWADGWVVSETGRVRVDPSAIAGLTVNPGNWVVLTG